MDQHKASIFYDEMMVCSGQWSPLLALWWRNFQKERQGLLSLNANIILWEKRDKNNEKVIHKIVYFLSCVFILNAWWCMYVVIWDSSGYRWCDDDEDSNGLWFVDVIVYSTTSRQHIITFTSFIVYHHCHQQQATHIHERTSHINLFYLFPSPISFEQKQLYDNNEAKDT